MRIHAMVRRGSVCDRQLEPEELRAADRNKCTQSACYVCGVFVWCFLRICSCIFGCYLTIGKLQLFFLSKGR